MGMRESSAEILMGMVLTFAACTDRDVVEDDDPDAPMAGEQPSTPGAMYSPCTAADDCPSKLCVFPKEEAGYCSGPCAAPTDASACGPAPGDQVTGCLDIGLPGGQWACALECEDGPCPNGMRCEHIAAGDGERAICF